MSHFMHTKYIENSELSKLKKTKLNIFKNQHSGKPRRPNMQVLPEDKKFQHAKHSYYVKQNSTIRSLHTQQKNSTF